MTDPDRTIVEIGAFRGPLSGAVVRGLCTLEMLESLERPTELECERKARRKPRAKKPKRDPLRPDGIVRRCWTCRSAVERVHRGLWRCPEHGVMTTPLIDAPTGGQSA